MNPLRKNGKKMDILIEGLGKQLRKCQIQIQETSVTWTGKGFGLRIKRDFAQKTTTISEGDSNDTNDRK